MYIVQMADLHFGAGDKESKREKEIVQESLAEIKKNVPKAEKILLCICGDIIDSYKKDDKTVIDAKERYHTASSLFDLMRGELEKDYQLTMKFCLGNHDITHVPEFYNCVKAYDPHTTEAELKSVFVFQEEQTHYIFVNSCYGDQYENGRIDYSSLEDTLKNLPREADKILVLHHTIMSMDDKDSSSIRNAARLLGLVNYYNIVGILHGHIHGRDILTIGNNQCRVIGTGALFSRKNDDVNSQFNIIYYKKGHFRKILNCRFIADGSYGGNKWDTLDIGEIKCENYFKGERFSSVYSKLLNELEVHPTLYHVVLHINSSYKMFQQDINKFLGKDTLDIGQRKYPYFKLGEMWEEIHLPSELYFNHGQYFNVDGKHGIELIARHLKDKPTSSRAVLATSSMDTVTKNLEEPNCLPSLSCIQFSKGNGDQNLYVHMQLRALEAGRFLKINICEIYYLLGQLRREEIRFEQVNIVISAFRVQVKEKFNCFLKAGIDQADQTQLIVKVNNGKISELCQMLEEKKDATETITNSKGLSILCHAMETTNDERKRDGKENLYSDAVIQKVHDILNIYEELNQIHKTRSEYSSEEKETDQRLEEKLDEIIKEFRTMTKQEEH